MPTARCTRSGCGVQAQYGYDVRCELVRNRLRRTAPRPLPGGREPAAHQQGSRRSQHLPRRLASAVCRRLPRRAVRLGCRRRPESCPRALPVPRTRCAPRSLPTLWSSPCAREAFPCPCPPSTRCSADAHRNGHGLLGRAWLRGDAEHRSRAGNHRSGVPHRRMVLRTPHRC